MAAGNTLASSSLLLPFVKSGALAAEDWRNNHILRTFDDAGQDEYQFRTVLPDALSTNPVGIDLILMWTASVTSGNVRWEAKIERLANSGSDIDSDSFASAKSNDAAVHATSGVIKYTTISFTAGAEMDNAAREELIRVHIRRNGTHANDTAAGPAQLIGWAIKESSGGQGPSYIPGGGGSTRVQFVDNFVNRYPAAGTALEPNGAQHWLKTETLGLGAIAATDGPGIALQFDAVAEIAVAEILGAKIWDIDKRPIFEFDFEINDVGDAAALDISIGLASATVNTDGDAVQESVFLHIDGNDLSLKFESDDNVVEVAATDSTIDAVANQRHRVRFDFTNKADVQIYVDDVNVLPATVFNMTNYSGLLSMVVNMEKTSDDTTAKVTIRRAAVDIDV